MGLPGHRRTSSHKRRRASHFALKVANLTRCAHCQQPVRPHQVCSHCGYYRGRQVIKVKSKVGKRAKAKQVEAKKEDKPKAK